MPNDYTPTTASQPTVYEIRLAGHLDGRWTDWFGGLTIVLEDGGDTLLIGPVVDQSALYGLLRQVRDLGMPLLSVNRVEPNQADLSPADAAHWQALRPVQYVTRGEEMETPATGAISAWETVRKFFKFGT